MSLVVFDYKCCKYPWHITEHTVRRPAPNMLPCAFGCGYTSHRQFPGPRTMSVARAGGNQVRAMNKGVASEADHPPWITKTESMGDGMKWGEWHAKRQKYHDAELDKRIEKEHGDPRTKITFS